MLPDAPDGGERSERRLLLSELASARGTSRQHAVGITSAMALCVRVSAVLPVCADLEAENMRAAALDGVQLGVTLEYALTSGSGTPLQMITVVDET